MSESYYQYVEPVETPQTGPLEGNEYSHPAYGTISASRGSGGHGVLFQSAFKHNNTMRVRIHRATMRRGLAHDWVSDGEELIEIEMSEAQWATFISTPNSASTPCTLKHIDRERVPQIPEVMDKEVQFKGEFKQAMVEGLARLEVLMKTIAESNLPQKKKEELRIQAECVGYALGSNIDYVAGQFGKHVEKTVESAKIEVHAYMTGTIARAGLKALSGEAPPLDLQLIANKETP